MEIEVAVKGLFFFLTICSVLYKRKGKPAPTLGWLLFLSLFPITGTAFWWIFGFRQLHERRKRHREHPTYGGFSPSEGNSVDVLIDSSEYFPALEKLIEEAKNHIHLEYYIWRHDETGRRIRDLLVKKAKQGVRVRVICDGYTAVLGNLGFMRPLIMAGGQTAVFLPLHIGAVFRVNYRNHRKIAIADGNVAITGGFNIGKEYRRRWHDLGAIVQGPAVKHFQEIFIGDWLYSTKEDLSKNTDLVGNPTSTGSAMCTVVASGPDERFNGTHDALFLAISQAKSRVYLTTPYFIPSSSLLTALRVAVFRGADVRLLVPGKSDVWMAQRAGQAYYSDLLDSGIRIFEYNRATLHGKAATFDDDVSFLGSANLDIRSFQLNFEASLFTNDRQLNAKLVKIFEEDCLERNEIKAARFRKRPLVTQIGDSLAHLFSPLL